MTGVTGLFSAKLKEMDEHYARLHDRIEKYQYMDHTEIVKEKKALEKDYHLAKESMAHHMEMTKLLAAEELSKAQIEYCNKAADIMKNAMSHSCKKMWEGQTTAETTALYAEYAIDFASLAMGHALLAVLSAVDAQLTEDEMIQGNEE